MALGICIALFVLLGLGMHVGFAMALAGFLGFIGILHLDSALHLLGQTVFETALNFELSVIPLFVLMGFLASSSGLSSDLYKAFNTWLGASKGGVGMATIGACGAFGAITGSSLATAATMTEVALPEMKKFGYSDSLATGVIAGGGTLGILIPPSVIMVIYGIMTETDIGDLFLAGFIPGILLVILFMVTVRLLVAIKPESGPPGVRSTRHEKIKAFKNVGGTIALFVMVLGGIYLGVFTPTEAAGVGAAGALLLGTVMRRMTLTILLGALLNTVRTTVMIFTILIGALIFKNFMAIAQVPTMIESLMAGLDLTAMGTLVVILIIYIFLGAVLDTMAMILLTLPVFFPLVSGLGFDAVWFGVLLVVVVEMALISPPMGINVFVIRGMAKSIPIAKIYWGVLPFVVAQAVLLAALLAFPELALWLPGTAR